MKGKKQLSWELSIKYKYEQKRDFVAVQNVLAFPTLYKLTVKVLFGPLSKLAYAIKLVGLVGYGQHHKIQILGCF